jgi:DNA-binding transcriptional LysR family regulator
MNIYQELASVEAGRSMRGAQFARLTAFAAVAERNSFTRAAKHLGISTPSVSMAVRGLEEEFGVRLLNRTTRSVVPTEAGACLCRHLGPLLEGLGNAIDAVNAFKDKAAGSLRLVVHPVAGLTVLAPLVASFSAEYPGILLDISIDAEPRDIVSARFDAGIHHADAIAQDMIAVSLGPKFRLSTVASPTYLASKSMPSTPAELRGHSCIRNNNERTATSWKFQKTGRNVEIAIDGPLIVNDMDLALRAALDGAGIAQLPEALVSSYVGEGRLVPLLDDWTPQRPAFVIYYSGRRLRKFINFVLKRSRRPAEAGSTA